MLGLFDFSKVTVKDSYLGAMHFVTVESKVSNIDTYAPFVC